MKNVKNHLFKTTGLIFSNIFNFVWVFFMYNRNLNSNTKYSGQINALE